MSALSILVNIRQVYGNEAIYPACDKSKTFARLAKHTTLTRRDLELIRELGYTIHVSHGAAIALACQLNQGA